MTKDEKGWGQPRNAKKWHYFNKEPRSLCAGWMFTGDLDDNNHDHPDNCSICMKKRLELEK